MIVDYDPSTQKYGTWKCIKDTPIVKEVDQRYYYVREDWNHNILDSTSSSKSRIHGPISSRTLSSLYSTNIINDRSRVWCISMKEWKCLGDCVDLKLILNVFREEEQTIVDWDFGNTGTDYKYNQHEDTCNEKDIQNNSSTNENMKNDDVTLHDFLKGAIDDDDDKHSRQLHHDITDMTLTNNNIKSLRRPKNTTKFKSKHSKNWIYIQNLPLDTNEQELINYCSKVGLFAIHPSTQRPKVKMYKNKQNISSKYNPNNLKGDASVCYARYESVELAIQLLDQSQYRMDDRSSIIKVQHAKFEQHGDKYIQDTEKSNTKRKVARLTTLQALTWQDDDENGRITGGLKGLTIVILKYFFNPRDIVKEDQLNEIYRQIHMTCLKNQLGYVEKLTICSKHEEGVVIVKFKKPSDAHKLIQYYNRSKDNLELVVPVEAMYWDGVTDFTCGKEETQEETQKRLDDFGDWLESQELPEDFKLRTEVSMCSD